MYKKWNRIVEEVFGDDIKLVYPKYFLSKKNQVTLLELENRKNGEPLYIISKFFVWGDAGLEWDVLEKSHKAGLNVPKPLKKHKDIIFMEYIPGDNLHEISLRNRDSVNPEQIGKWLGKFHKTFMENDGRVLLKGDGMLPNFVVHRDSGELYGVDFEESGMGDPLLDITDLAATFLLSCPKFSNPRTDKVGIFMNSYKSENPIIINPESFKNLLLESMKKRCVFMPARKSEIEDGMTKVFSEIESML